MRINKKILLTILSGFIFIGQVFGQVVEQNSDEQHRQAACDEYWNGLASGINEHKTYKDREEYLQTVKSQLLHDNNDGTVLLDEFASEYLPNTFAKYEKAREKSLEIGQNLKSVFTKQLDNNSPEWSIYIKATEKYSQILWEEKRIQNGISYIYLFHKVGAMSDEMLAKLDKSEKMNFIYERDFTHDLNQYQTKKVDGVMEFAQKNMPETFALLETFEKEINETKVQFDRVYAEAEKLNYFLGNTTHPVFIAFEFKYKKTIEKYNNLMGKVDELQVKHLLLEVTGEDLASQDSKIAKEHKAFKDSLPELVKTIAHKVETFYVEKIIETMVQIPGKDYLMGKYEVTQAQWQLIMGNNPSEFKGDLTLPVENVSWNDCQKFIKKLNSCSKETGYTFFLPTEEEWEYACRAGSTGKYGLLADGREGILDEMGWYKDNSGEKTHPVGQKKPNAWGLYDMHGNVMERTASKDKSYSISRGGSWRWYAGDCEAGRRSSDPGFWYSSNLGFRLAASRTETSVKEIIETKTSVKEIIETMVQIPGKDYFMGKYEVTQAQWQLIMGENPSWFTGDLSRPVEEISWYDCQEFIKKLNACSEVESAGITFRLPTQNEWEYACRAGSTGKYGLLADGREGTLGEMGWYKDNSGKETHPVGQKTPNAWGLYDMHGNVEEWTTSEYHSDRIYRGGGWCDDAESCGAGYWYGSISPGRTYYSIGFRLVASRTETSVKETVEPKTSVKEIIETMVQIPGEDYLMGKYEVTQAQWQAIMGNNPSYFEGDLSRPVEQVSWNDCQEFIKKLNACSEVKSAGITFRLPTSEQWEYACRAGSTGKYGLLADGREGTLDEMDWYEDNSGGKTYPVGQKKPNAWGLYDMHGNVSEWTASGDSSNRICRGGCCYGDASRCESDIGGRFNPEDRYCALGFRLAASRIEK